MSIKGFWFEANSSTRKDATLEVIQSSYQLIVAGQHARDGQLSEVVVSARMGNIPRRLVWPDGALLETHSNDVVDLWLARVKHRSTASGLVHRMESSWKWAVSGLLVTVLVSFLGIRYGLPAASESIARNLPASFNASTSTQALAALDKLLFGSTKTPINKRIEVHKQFNDLLSALPESDVEFKLHFRSMKGIPNAMALPGGDVVVTDAFLELVEHPQELDSVLLHEIGHVIEHHGMTQVIRASALSIIVTLALGDLSAFGDLAVGVPIFIMQNNYSQTAESEADDYAFARMREMGKDPRYFADIILRLSEVELDEDSELLEDGSEDKSGYFSSHPDSRSRAIKALEASRSMHQTR